MLTLEQIDSIEKYQIPNLIAAQQSEAAETVRQLCETVRDCYGLLGWIPDSTQASVSEIHEEI